MENVIDTIGSQFANSPRLLALINSFNDAVDPAVLFEEFYNKIWNVETAQSYGLDVWGRIVVIGRVLKIIQPREYFWWHEATTSAHSWGNRPWFRSRGIIENNYVLTDEAYRLLILTKAMANIADGTIPTYNRMLMLMFPGRGNVYVIDNFDMTVTINFTLGLSKYERAIIEQSGAFPPPCGQKILIISALEMRDELELVDGLEML